MEIQRDKQDRLFLSELIDFWWLYFIPPLIVLAIGPVILKISFWVGRGFSSS